MDFRKSIDGLAALIELDIKVAAFDPVLFVFLNRHRSRVKVLYCERNGFCLWLKRLASERFKISPDEVDPVDEVDEVDEATPYASNWGNEMVTPDTLRELRFRRVFYFRRPSS